jgi:thiamine-phosphate pyrophosphorylase
MASEPAPSSARRDSSRALPRLVAFSPGVLGVSRPAEGPADGPAGWSESGSIGDLLRRVGAASEAGLPGLVLREPSLPDGPFLALARACRGLVPWLALHDRPHLVGCVGADAVHLGFRSLPAKEARVVMPSQTLVGWSAHAHDREHAAAAADYVTFGPVYATPSKTGLVPTTGAAGLAAYSAASSRPVLALGGVTAGTVAACLAAGAHGVAAIGDLLGHADPAARTRAFLKALTECGASTMGDPSLGDVAPR